MLDWLGELDRLWLLERLRDRLELDVRLLAEDEDLLLDADDLLLDDVDRLLDEEELLELRVLLTDADWNPIAANSTRSASDSMAPRLSRRSMGTLLAISATTTRACWASGAACSDW